MDNCCKIGIFGSNKCGKSAFYIQFVQHVFVENYDPTIESDFRKQIEVDGKVFLLEIYDIKEDELKALKENVIKISQGFFLLYSITDSKSLCECEEIFDEIKKNIGNEKQPPIILIGCKSDNEEERKVSFENGKKVAEKLNLSNFFESSSKMRKNIDEPWMEMVRLIYKNNGKKNEKESKSCKLM